MPRHHALLAALAAFAIGLIAGAVGVYVSPYRVNREAIDHVQAENDLLRKANVELRQYVSQVQFILKASEDQPDAAVQFPEPPAP